MNQGGRRSWAPTSIFKNLYTCDDVNIPWISFQDNYFYLSFFEIQMQKLPRLYLQ